MPDMYNNTYVISHNPRTLNAGCSFKKLQKINLGEPSATDVSPIQILFVRDKARISR